MGVVRLLDCGRITLSDVRALLGPSDSFNTLTKVFSK